MKIVVVGVGYVGLVSGACFADMGHTVVCIDTDVAKIDGLERGVMPIFEPGLAELVRSNVDGGRLSFGIDLSAAMDGADAAFIAVGTPTNPADGSANLDYVRSAARAIGRALTGPLVVVTKSTVPVGTGDMVEALIAEEAPGSTVSVVSNPEFLREGSAIGDFQKPDRIVVGSNDAFGREVLGRIYKPLHVDDAPILFTTRRTSELIKYASNAFLATKIGFINQIADLCEAIGADVQDVSRGMGLDARIGPRFLDAGPGYGGSCFPKDTLALVRTARDAKTPVSIVEAVVEANDARKQAMGQRVLNALGGSPEGKRVALLGLTFKPNTDDMRESPSVEIVEVLQAAGVEVVAFDPAGVHEAQKLFTNIDYAADPWQACSGADAAVLVTEWGVFRNLDLVRLAGVLRHPVLVDLRNIFDPAGAAAAGLAYSAIGRAPTIG